VNDKLTVRTRPVDRFLNFLTSPLPGKDQSRFDGFFSTLTKVFLAVATVVFVAAPIAAWFWYQQPFPGFFIEQTLVVNSMGKPGWSGRSAGLDFPQQVTQIQGNLLENIPGYHRVLSAFRSGERIEVVTRGVAGQTYRYPEIVLESFPAADFWWLFWMPYSVGLVYLISGYLVFRSRGHTRSGSVFAYTAVTGAMALALTFDLSTTHLGSLLWIISISQIGGALISLAIVFPEELQPFYRRARIRLLAHSFSLGLAVWGVATLYSMSNPWSYILPWRWSYIYAGVGFTVFLLTMAFRLRPASDSLAYQQARIIFWGSLIAFSPLAIWFMLQLLIVFPFSNALLIPPLVIFPIVVGLAILRYRLWDIDLIIRKTIVYSVLMSVLTLVYLAGIILAQTVVDVINRDWGERLHNSPLAVVLFTLATVALFSPLRIRIQRLVDRSFYRTRYDAEKLLERFSEQLRNDVNLEQVTGDILAVVEETMHPEFTRLWLKSKKLDKTTQEDLGGNLVVKEIERR
jgi:hypothetical protein